MPLQEKPEVEASVSPRVPQCEELILEPATGKELAGINKVRALRNLPPLTREQTTHV